MGNLAEKKHAHPLVSVTLITHNRKDDVRVSLDEIKKITYPNLELIIVDNDSNDGTAEMIEREYPAIKLMRLKENRPFYARGLCFEHARGKYVVTLDDDSYPEPGAITKMVERFEHDPCLGIIAFNVVCGDYSTTWLWPEAPASYGGLFIACGAGFRKEVFERIGSYWADELMETYADEYDFTYRAYAAGYTLGHFKDLIVHHRPRRNPERMRRFFYRNERNQNYIMGKFVYPRHLPMLYLRSTFYRLLRAYHLEGRSGLFWAIIGNTWGARYMLKGFFNKCVVPPFVEFYICYTRGYNESLLKFFFSSKARQRVMAGIISEEKAHSFCPRMPLSEDKIDQILHLRSAPKVEKLIFINEMRLSFILLRNKEEQLHLLKFILSEVAQILSGWRKELILSWVYTVRFQKLASKLNNLMPRDETIEPYIQEIPAIKARPFVKIGNIILGKTYNISIVIPTYNRARLLTHTLKSILQQTHDSKKYETIVVDDGSIDETQKVVRDLERQYPQHTIRYFYQTNSGPAKARNRGIREARGEIIFFTDDDCTVPKDWIINILGSYDRYPGVAGVGGWHVPPAHEIDTSAVSRYLRLTDFSSSIVGKIIESHEILSSSPFMCFGIFAYDTANMSYKREILEEIGGFREDFYWPGSEDTDLAFRVFVAGHALLYIPFHVIHSKDMSLADFAKINFRRGANGYLLRRLNYASLEKLWPGSTERYGSFPAYRFRSYRQKSPLAFFQWVSMSIGILYMKRKLEKQNATN